jgi:HAD superfamily hydrolase (TIGR01549 family)
LQWLRTQLPISIFSNIELANVLPLFGIDPAWFTHILSAGMVAAPKPALAGFQKMVELSQIEPPEILYIGDDVAKDVRPAKTVGIQTGLLWSQSPEADYSFTDFQSILDLLK